jgi:hypothetical protein
LRIPLGSSPTTAMVMPYVCAPFGIAASRCTTDCKEIDLLGAAHYDENDDDDDDDDHTFNYFAPYGCWHCRNDTHHHF